MSTLRLALLALAILIVALLPTLFLGKPPADDQRHVMASLADAEEISLPQGYAQQQRALTLGDLASLEELYTASDGYLAYSSALSIALNGNYPTASRLQALLRALDLRIDDPLRRAENLELLLLKGELALAEGETEMARGAYLSALPDPRATEQYASLEPNAYRRAAAFQNAGMQSRALAELGELTAPSIEAPALRALGRHDEALAAYRRWLEEAPTNEEALVGEAWSLFYLGSNVEAREAFGALGSAGHYGLGLLDNRAGDIDGAVTHLVATGRADLLWLATTLLEARDRWADAVPVYMLLAAGSTAYADDAAYRALVLANRLGDTNLAEEARALLPAGGFFDLKLGGEPTAPDPSSAQVGALTEAGLVGGLQTGLASEVASLARALQSSEAGDAAVGELLFALREAEAGGDPLTIVEVAELLQGVDEYRQSMRAARALLSAGVDDLRVWRLAYPPAWPEKVLIEAQESGVEPALIWAVMRQESAFSEVAVSRSGAMGLMQVMPTTWDWIAELRSEEPAEPFSVRSNIAYGATYLGWLLRYFGGDEELVIASYNGGQGYVRRLFESEGVGEVKDEFYREIDHPETREYLQSVYENLETYRRLYPRFAQLELVGSD